MKVLLAKPGLDGHDVGVKVLAHALREAGFEVAYTGLRKSIEQIADQAQLLNPDVIGLSILSGSHLILCAKMRDELERRALNIPWIVGGNIPDQDVKPLIELGARCAFPSGTRIEEVIRYFEGMKQSAG
ncbi:MAG: cobalamin-dependent protein [Saprospiraceae bacterium]|jgi:methylmalonyl-CoA mutase C-terminal domain/subunit|nr:cobalamin-dependent protein [Saprospiraceae bacterium]MBP9209740.1 cobalamin-dependent protein [Saprospiraceae bacterium]MBV6474085.1 putative methylmalonyl-CoA mutase large subunit [Saprospiraceae bacterium]